MTEQVAVIGAGSWGTALSITLANKGHNVRLWARDESQVTEMTKSRENKKYLADAMLPESLFLSTSLELVVKESKYIVLSVPTGALRDVLLRIKEYLREDAILINTAKGIEPESLLLMSEVIEEELGELENPVAVLSGPSHAEEVGRNLPTVVVAASESIEVSKKVQDLFISPTFRVYTNDDIVGVEIGGALKNVIALACGVSDGLGFGDNSKAALITRGMIEIARLGVKMGAKPETFAGLTGIGDLVVTCTSMYSRNRRAGIALGQGKGLETILEEMGMVVEGVRTAKAAKSLCEKYKVDLPIALGMYEVLFNNLAPDLAAHQLMTRAKTKELKI